MGARVDGWSDEAFCALTAGCPSSSRRLRRSSSFFATYSGSSTEARPCRPDRSLLSTCSTRIVLLRARSGAMSTGPGKKMHRAFFGRIDKEALPTAPTVLLHLSTTCMPRQAGCARSLEGKFVRVETCPHPRLVATLRRPATSPAPPCCAPRLILACI